MKTKVNYKGEQVPVYNVNISKLTTINDNHHYRVFIDSREVCLIVVADFDFADDLPTWGRAINKAYREADRILKSEAERTFDCNYGLKSGSYIFENNQ